MTLEINLTQSKAEQLQAIQQSRGDSDELSIEELATELLSDAIRAKYSSMH